MNVLIIIGTSILTLMTFLNYFWPSAYATLINAFYGILSIAFSLIIPLLNAIPFPEALSSFTLPSAPSYIYGILTYCGFNSIVGMIAAAMLVRSVRKATILLR